MTLFRALDGILPTGLTGAQLKNIIENYSDPSLQQPYTLSKQYFYVPLVGRWAFDEVPPFTTVESVFVFNMIQDKHQRKHFVPAQRQFVRITEGDHTVWMYQSRGVSQHGFDFLADTWMPCTFFNHGSADWGDDRLPLGKSDCFLVQDGILKFNWIPYAKSVMEIFGVNSTHPVEVDGSNIMMKFLMCFRTSRELRYSAYLGQGYWKKLREDIRDLALRLEVPPSIFSDSKSAFLASNVHSMPVDELLEQIYMFVDDFDVPFDMVEEKFAETSRDHLSSMFKSFYIHRFIQALEQKETDMTIGKRGKHYWRPMQEHDLTNILDHVDLSA